MRISHSETNRCAVSEEENIYGVLKNQFEDSLEAHATRKTKVVALRLDVEDTECPIRKASS